MNRMNWIELEEKINNNGRNWNNKQRGVGCGPCGLERITFFFPNNIINTPHPLREQACFLSSHQLLLFSLGWAPREKWVGEWACYLITVLIFLNSLSLWNGNGAKSLISAASFIEIQRISNYGIKGYGLLPPLTSLCSPFHFIHQLFIFSLLFPSHLIIFLFISNTSHVPFTLSVLVYSSFCLIPSIL